MDPQRPLPPSTARRNPSRKARETPSIAARNPPTSTAPTISAPIDELLLPGGSQNPPPKPDSTSENLKVFLRIRPLDVKPNDPGRKPLGIVVRKKGKGAPARNGRAKSGDVFLVVNDSSSVTLSAPSLMTESKRLKSEVYDGFACVFPSESLQDEVYERVMDPLVKDFLEGKSSLLVAMGPTGSGKTHTMFGCPREPGLVPQALQKIFSHPDENGGLNPSRLYYLSMFEIHSERGKGESILDLSPNGVELSLQQSSIKGLQEIMVSNLADAHNLVARGMLKRSTAMTNANSQSSRSQCIINLRNPLEKLDHENEFLPTGAILTIVDLAGAERERKTGNQGVRLLESNFINNTSLVFGQCLRSLLEHQKNPKKPLQKHFKSSLLTRYLREYLEGKKQMTLILTVKPGEDDYLDTLFILRQASPFMKIKYSNLEDEQNMPPLKRITAHAKLEHPKRRKINNSDSALVTAGKTNGVEAQHSGKDVDSEFQEPRPSHSSSASVKSLDTVLENSKPNEYCFSKAQRSEEVMTKFARALWNVLKQYKQKLKESGREVRRLKESLRQEKTFVFELEKELKELRSCCSCSEHPLTIVMQQLPNQKGETLAGNIQEIGEVQEKNESMPNEVSSSMDFSGSSHSDDFDTLVQTHIHLGEARNMEQNSPACDEKVDTCNTTCSSSITEEVIKTSHQKSECILEFTQCANDPKGLSGLQISPCSATLADTLATPSQPYHLVEVSKGSLALPEDRKSSVSEKVKVKGDSPAVQQSQLYAPDTEDELNDKGNSRKPLEKAHVSASKPRHAGKPRRRLLPASAMLLREFSDLSVDVENPKENRSKQCTEGIARSQGSFSLIQLLKSNVHH